MRHYFRIISTVMILLVAGIFLISCGSSGGGSSSSSGSSGGSGTAAIFIADGPADDYESIWITITEVSLIPANDGSPVVIFESSKGHKIDLLQYRDEDYLLTVRDGIPAGVYEKIRLRVSDVRTKGGDCDRLDVKLPSGKIDLNPRGGFRVVKGETISIRLDIDANKSINLHKAGNSGKCIYRPVVFVDIDTVKGPQRCPRILKGTIRRLIDNNEDGDTDGFVLDLGGQRGDLKVYLTDHTVIFDQDGSFAGPDALEPGQRVKVRGRLKPDGALQASVVVIGGSLVLKGTVTGAVETVDGRELFPLDLDRGQEVVDNRIDVVVTSDTLVLLGCDREVDLDAIQPGMRARVVGKISGGDLLAVVVLLEAEQITGELIDISSTTGGRYLTVKTGDSSEVKVFLPVGVPVFLEGDGQVDLDLLTELVECKPRVVRIMLDPDEPDLTATSVYVQADKLVGQVSWTDSVRPILTLIGGQTVQVQPGATILADEEDSDDLVLFNYIQAGDELTLFGFEACDGDDVDFYAFIVLIKDRPSTP